MKTALLLTNSAETQRALAGIVGEAVSFIPLPPPPEPGRESFDGLFNTWLRLADAVVVDAVALGESTRWAIESLEAVARPGEHAVIVLATSVQRSVYPMAEGWLVLTATDSLDQLKQSILTFLELHEARARLQRNEALLARQRRRVAPAARLSAAGGTTAVDGARAAESTRYRDALKSMSRLFGECRVDGDQGKLLGEFLQLVRELLSVAKAAVFMRRYQSDLFTGRSGPVGAELSAAVCSGIGSAVVQHLRLRLDSGIGGYLAGQARILRRDRVDDPMALEYEPQIEREFQLLGTEVAVPMFDQEELIGVLSFGGKITGDEFTNEELELVYHLMMQLAAALRNLQLLEQVAGQGRFMSDVLAHVQSGVVVIGQGGRILSLNRQARRLLELGSEELVGQNISRLPSHVASVIFEALQTGREILDREVTVSRGQRALGVSATRFATRAVNGGADNAGLVAVGLIEDRTQLKQQQAQSRALAEREFFVRLASRLSHELKNSMVAIKIFAQLLPVRYAEKEFREQFSGTVVNEINRLDVLLNNLTFFAHPLALVCEEVVLTELIDACLGNIGEEFPRKQLAHVLPIGENPPAGAPELPVVTVKKNLGHRPSRLTADKLRLTQALEHLLRNAVQAVAQTGRGGRLTISTADAQAADFPGGRLPEGGGVRIEVQDTGEGIPLEELKRVTEPFVTTRNVGVGLGLTIVKKIVQQHGGQLRIDSMLGQGTTAVISLPMRPPPQPEDSTVGAAPAAGGELPPRETDEVRKELNRLKSAMRAETERPD
jgi:signal transduction histidine kinase